VLQFGEAEHEAVAKKTKLAVEAKAATEPKVRAGVFVKCPRTNRLPFLHAIYIRSMKERFSQDIDFL